MKHICVDLETMGTRPDSAIVSIGAVAFEPAYLDGGALVPEKYGATLYQNVDLQSSLDAGLTVTGNTVVWWLNQSDAARKAITAEPRVSLACALENFRCFWKHQEAEWLWCRGMDFDISILRTAHANLGLPHPWPYNHACDARTLYRTVGVTPEGVVPTVGDAHNALDDAMWEARAICYAKHKQLRDQYDLRLLEARHGL